MISFSYIKSSFKIIFEELLNIIYNDTCAHCLKSNKEGALCKRCAKTVQILPCFAHKKYEGVQIFSATIYDCAIKSLIHKLKFNHKRSAAKVLANILNDYYNNLPAAFINSESHNNITVVPVPTHKNNINKRGYNNVFEVAKIFAKNNNLKIESRLLIKTKHTEPMYKISANLRRKNIKGVFRVNPQYYKGERLIIIDDIFTTGATAEEIIKEFKKENINNILIITLSKVV